MKTLKDLFFACLNATLILAIATLVCLILLIGKVTQLRDTTAQAVSKTIQPQVQRLEALTASVQSIETRLATREGNDANLAPLTAEIAKLNSQISEIRTTFQNTDKVQAKEIARQAVKTLTETLQNMAPSPNGT